MTVRSKNARQDTEEGGTCEGKRLKLGDGESIHLDGQHVTEFTMFAYEWY